MKIQGVLAVIAGLALAVVLFLLKSNESPQGRGGDSVVVNLSWTPPKAKLDAGYLSAVKALLGDGLSDPRNRQFCKVKPLIGEARSAPFEACGWVSPDGKSAVLFDGIEYPIASASAPVDVEGAIGSLSGMGGAPGSEWFGTSSPALPALLDLTGNIDAAESAFANLQGRAFSEPVATMLFSHLAQRYAMLAGQALAAHDDREGLKRAKQLLLVNHLRESSHVPRPSSPPPVASGDTSPNAYQTVPYAQRLVADLQRRLDHPKTTQADLVGLSKLDQPHRIEVLIEDLDTIASTNDRTALSVRLSRDPVFKTLVQQGTASVPALIDTIQNDDRFSRTTFNRPAPDSILTVKDVAWRAILEVWPSAERWQPDPTKIGGAETLRKAWKDCANLTEPQRWLKVLQDDRVDTRIWLLAGESLVEPEGKVLHSDSLYEALPNSGARMAGASLRPAHLEEVSRLMAKRALEIASANGSKDLSGCADALRLAHCLAVWNLPGSVDCLREVCAKSIETAKRLKKLDAGSQIEGTLGIVIADRARAHDPTAAADYSALLNWAKATRTYIDFNVFRPMWESQTDMGIQRAGDRFLDTWAAQLTSNDPRQVQTATGEMTRILPVTPFLTIPAYRRLLIVGLKNDLATGLLLEASGFRQLPDKGGPLGRKVFPGAKPGQKNNPPNEMSIGDGVADSLTSRGMKGLPPFDMKAPLAQRAAQRSKLADFFADDKRDWLAIAKSSPSYALR